MTAAQVQLPALPEQPVIERRPKTRYEKRIDQFTRRLGDLSRENESLRGDVMALEEMLGRSLALVERYQAELRRKHGGR
jgi:hypothetical protein